MYLSRRIFGFAVVVAVAGCGQTASTMTADEAVRAGWHYFQLEEFDRAERAFQEALGKVDSGGVAGALAVSGPPTTGAAGGTKSVAADALRINALYG